MPPAVIPIAGAVIGGIMSNEAADTASEGAQAAANTQAAAADRATQLQKQIYQQNRADLAPVRAGLAPAFNRLMQMAGLQPQPLGEADWRAMQQGLGTAGTTDTGKPLTLAQITEQLRPQYTTQGQWQSLGEGGWYNPATGQQMNVPYGDLPSLGTVDTAGLNAAAQAQFNAQQAGSGGANAYADYLKNFNAEYAKPYEFVNSDPGAQYRMREANKALERSAAARGGLLSGSTLKALAELNQELASQEYGAAFNRVAGVAGMGSGATSVGINSANQFGNAAASNIMGAGNAAAAGQLAGANASMYGKMGIGQAISNAAAPYYNKLMVPTQAPAPVQNMDIGGYGGGAPWFAGYGGSDFWT